MMYANSQSRFIGVCRVCAVTRIGRYVMTCWALPNGRSGACAHRTTNSEVMRGRAINPHANTGSTF
ncbi:hypothetical protein [Lysobacter gummosus]|uniref:hypothetical protein n=1 Tax=Lysobacter gummosus TaxID=262324 RepID=UPI00363E65DF